MTVMSEKEVLASRMGFANPELVNRLEARLPQMLEELAALSDLESPTNSLDALGTCARYLETLGTTLLGKRPQRLQSEGRNHLLWQFGETPRIVLVGHYDTVHPLGTVLRFPFSIDGDVARGPGVCDMKGGVIIAMHVVRELLESRGPEALDGLCLFLNCDEEIGSPTSKAFIWELAKTTKYAVGFENAIDWRIKTERRGTSHYNIIVKGRSAHAGDAASVNGINAIHELCAQVAVVDAIADAEAGTCITPTTAAAGTTTNTVPEDASMWVDVRARTKAEQQRVDREIRLLKPLVTAATIKVAGGIEQPPMPDTSSLRLFEIAAEVSKELGFGELFRMAVGGAADTCRFADAGTEAIDGFGAVGGGDHSDREWIYTGSLSRQAALAAGLVEKLLSLP